MVPIKKLVLDVLKPHQPNAIDFAVAIAKAGLDYHVQLTVFEVDKNTETVQVEIEGNAIDFAAIQSSIQEMGGSLHSIDEVVVHSDTDID